MKRIKPAPTNEQLKTTEKAESLKENSTDVKLSETLGIARNTLYSRLKFSNWKTSEIALINILFKSI